MIASNPQTIDGKTYDRYSINFAVTGKYNANGTPDASVALRLIPTRIEDGVVETNEENAKAIVFGTMEHADNEAKAAFAAISAALQSYLNSKGV